MFLAYCAKRCAGRFPLSFNMYYLCVSEIIHPKSNAIDDVAYSCWSLPSPVQGFTDNQGVRLKQFYELPHPMQPSLLD